MATVKAVVVGVDVYRWSEGEGDNRVIQSAPRGEEIEISEEEFARAEKMSADDALTQPALMKAGTKAAKEALAAESDEQPEEPSPASE